MQKQNKESLTVMMIKTLLIFLLLMGVTIVIVSQGYIIEKRFENAENNQITKPAEIETEDYYDLLEKRCDSDDGCCLSSLDIMRQGDYKEADKNGKCLDEFEMNMQKCITSFQWCEPIEESCKKHGEIPDYTAPGDDMSVQCCNGLKHKIQKKYFDENCVNLFEEYGYGGYAGICVNCGDGICDVEFENQCNCSEDCGEEVDTSNWQTYRNEEFGFEVKYPGNLKVEQPVSDVFIIYVSSENKKEYLQIQWMTTAPPFTFKSNGEPTGHSPNGAEYVGKKVIGNKESIKYYTNNPFYKEENDLPFTRYIIRLGNKEWIYMEYHGEKDVSDFFDQILSSFKFIEKDGIK